MSSQNKKALIAMSGGVDSSVAAYLTKQNNYDCIGATMKLFSGKDDEERPGSCCSESDIMDAKGVAFRLSIPYYVFNFKDRFNECVIDKFVTAYENGATPNPCVDCNRYLKFEKLFLRARELKADYVVTGHYAHIEFCEESGRYLLKKAVDNTKDQSYFLYTLTQEQLAHTLFPLGALKKTQVREIAEQCGFLNAKKHDSQDICFVENGKYADFIESYRKRTYPDGDFVDKNGKVLGRHKGIIRYTIGQRRGLGIAYEHPLYVIKINTDDNTVVLGEERDLYQKEVFVRDLNLISVEDIKEPMRVKAKVRYSQGEKDAVIEKIGADEIKITFDEPQRAATKGQAAVFYDNDTVIGGGVIE